MSHRFHQCLAVVLCEETGYRQPVGGPFLRHADGSVHIPRKADGNFFSDDPHDRGGRTGAGLLQREYDAWRKRRGLPTQDVWLIADDEIVAIYSEQYWQAVRGDELPRGVDLSTFDMSVLCGVGAAVKCLQQALGVTADGHMGAITLQAAHAANPVELLPRVRASRERYLRGCPTFWAHGNGWLSRTARVIALADADADTVVALGSLAAETPAIDPTVPTPPRAHAAAEPETMVQSSTGNAAVVGAGGTLWAAWTHFATTLQRIAERGDPISVRTVACELITDPVALAMAAALLSAAYVWFERRRKLRGIA